MQGNIHSGFDARGRMKLVEAEEPRGALSSWDEKMWVRYALAVAAIALSTCVSAAGSERGRNSGGAEADHRRCVDYYRLKPGSAKYAECRKQLARQPRAEPQRRQPEERSIWSPGTPMNLAVNSGATHPALPSGRIA